MAVIVTTHLAFIYYANRVGTRLALGDSTSPITMLRAGSAASMFIPWTIWLLKESLVASGSTKIKTIRQSLPWFALCVALAAISFSTWYYYTPELLPADLERGPGYAKVNLSLIAVYTYLVGQSWLQMRRQIGIKRIEMQFLVVNSALIALLAVGLALGSHYLKISALRQVNRLVEIFACALTAWAVCYYRVYDLKQALTSLGQRFALVLILGLGTYIGWLAFDNYMPHIISLVLSIAITSTLAFRLDRQSRGWLGIDGERELLKQRQSVINLARLEAHPEQLVAKLERLLCHQSGASVNFLLLVDQDQVFASGITEFSKGRPGYAALYEFGWATPESLVRRRPTALISDLRSFMAEHFLGLMVAVPRGSPSPTLLLAMGIKENDWPFTYPEVLRLQNIAELMDNILTRSRLTMQAAIQAKLEHLSMMSRGLAHDLNNLITPVSSFLIYTDQRLPAEAPEREVHDAAKRSVRVMTDYVREALFFSDRLTPRFEPLNLGRLFEEVYGLMNLRATKRGITITTAIDHHDPTLADAVLLQRVLTNIVGNAIDASIPGQNVHLSATRGRSGWLCLQVSDAGCGIAPENIQQIFDPYFTTKKFGDEVRGFGLGLTICQKIVHLHSGVISVKSQPGRGTTLTIELPALQKPIAHSLAARAMASTGP